jgi:hypothetical protein
MVIPVAGNDTAGIPGGRPTDLPSCSCGFVTCRVVMVSRFCRSIVPDAEIFQRFLQLRIRQQGGAWRGWHSHRRSLSIMNRNVLRRQNGVLQMRQQ